MELEVADDAPGGWTVVAASGEIDATGAPVLADRLADLGPGTRIVLDLAEVTFLDSAGLAGIRTVHHRARAAGGDLRLAGADARIARVLAVSELDRVVPVSDTIAAAVEGA